MGSSWAVANKFKQLQPCATITKVQVKEVLASVNTPTDVHLGAPTNQNAAGSNPAGRTILFLTKAQVRGLLLAILTSLTFS
ncbi:MAG: hypothetical protein FWD93_03160 [Coriobacteriia bacterium]|nr:hypothetical protein [Coriobacteriia bacterium]